MDFSPLILITNNYVLGHAHLKVTGSNVVS